MRLNWGSLLEGRLEGWGLMGGMRGEMGIGKRRGGWIMLNVSVMSAMFFYEWAFVFV